MREIVDDSADRPERESGNATPTASTVEGFLDYVDGGRVVGWAYDSAAPGRRLLIEVTAGGSSSLVLANVERRDLKEAGKGDGRHGFVALLSADTGAVEVHARIATTGRELDGSPVRTGLVATLAHPSKRASLELFASEMQAARLLLAGTGAP